MREVVITGVGYVTPHGIYRADGNHSQLTENLLSGRSAVERDERYANGRFRSQVSARVNPEAFDEAYAERFDRRRAAWHGQGLTLKLGHLAADLAVDDAGVRDLIADNRRFGALLGTGGPSTEDQVLSTDHMRNLEHTTWQKKAGPRVVVPTMSSGLQAVVCTDLGIRGINFSITSACSTSLHCIGEAFYMIACGRQDVMLAGGSEDCHETKAQGFDAMPALCPTYNDDPQRASRAFDEGRKGFVEGEAGAVVVLEEYKHARKRGAQIYGKIIGYGATSDGFHMTKPSGHGAVEAMFQALEMAGNPEVQYINAHGTSTPEGDPKEAWAVAQVFGPHKPQMNSTKSQVGHSLGATGAAEAIFSAMQMRENYVAPSINIGKLAPDVAEWGWESFIPREAKPMPINVVLSNSFGFGGTNASLVMAKV